MSQEHNLALSGGKSDTGSIVYDYLIYINTWLCKRLNNLLKTS
ncbi:hypothetical protein [Vibrio parahaemolyticus]|nr:hypothetical protein [Vibrio parahaemolyticus]